NNGHAVGTIADKLVGRSPNMFFLFMILVLVLLVNAVFAFGIAHLFISFPASVLPGSSQFPLDVRRGYAVYKTHKELLGPSWLALAVMYIAAIMASKIDFLQIDLIRYFGGENGTGLFGLSTAGTAFFIWIMILMVYVYIASTLPVWKLLQPGDFINSHQLVV